MQEKNNMLVIKNQESEMIYLKTVIRKKNVKKI